MTRPLPSGMHLRLGALALVLGACSNDDPPDAPTIAWERCDAAADRDAGLECATLAVPISADDASLGTD